MSSDMDPMCWCRRKILRWRIDGSRNMAMRRYFSAGCFRSSGPSSPCRPASPRVNIYRFMLYTFLGALPWCYLLAYIGVKMGEQWEHLRDYFHQFDIVIGLCLALAVGLFSLVSLAETPHHSGVVTSPCSRSTTRSPGKRAVPAAPAEDRADVCLRRDGL